MTVTDDVATAEQFCVEGRHGDALATLDVHFRSHPRDARALHLLTVIRRALRDVDGAERTTAVVAGSPVASIQHVAGLIALDRGDTATAMLCLRRAMVCCPGHADSLKALARSNPSGGFAIPLAARAAVSVPGDVDAWIWLRAVIAVSGRANRQGSVRRLLGMAVERTWAESREFAGAARILLPDWGACASADGAELAAAEVAITKWVVHLSAQFNDTEAMAVGLGSHLRRLAVWFPHVRTPWLSSLALEGGRAGLDERPLSDCVRRVAAFGGVSTKSTRFDRPFEACVTVKAAAMASPDIAASFVGHALGRRALQDAVRQPVSVRWDSGSRVVRVGDRAVQYAGSSTGAANFLALMFLYEPGLWRWMAGFGADDRLLDIGANIGIYSIAAAGLFGVPVAALEPYGPNVAALRRNVVSNGLQRRVAVHRIAASDVERIGRLYHTGGEAGAASQSFAGDAGDAAERSFEEVEGVPVDTLIERGRIAFPTRIKIDVDGNERAVIEGMTRTLADPRLHSVRLEVRWNEPAGRAVVARVRSFGFEARVDDDAKNLLFTRPKS